MYWDDLQRQRNRTPKIPQSRHIEFTSIQINHNTISAPHTDNNLNGFPSIAIGLGDYVGGRLRVGAMGPILHIRDHAVVFDGLETHSSGNYNGDRWSLVLFVHASWEKVPATMANELRKLGLPCPPTGQGPLCGGALSQTVKRHAQWGATTDSGALCTVALPAPADEVAPTAKAGPQADEENPEEGEIEDEPQQ